MKLKKFFLTFLTVLGFAYANSYYNFFIDNINKDTNYMSINKVKDGLTFTIGKKKDYRFLGLEIGEVNNTLALKIETGYYILKIEDLYSNVYIKLKAGYENKKASSDFLGGLETILITNTQQNLKSFIETGLKIDKDTVGVELNFGVKIEF